MGRKSGSHGGILTQGAIHAHEEYLDLTNEEIGNRNAPYLRLSSIQDCKKSRNAVDNWSLYQLRSVSEPADAGETR